MKKLLSLWCLLLLLACGKESGNMLDSNTAKNGSLSRFAIKDQCMYALDFDALKVFDISDNNRPELKNTLKLDFGIETISIYGNYIYVGAINGIYIVDIKSAFNPILLQKVEHHISCDPVVIQNDIAYSTQRSNAVDCGNAWSRSLLLVYDVKDPINPKEINSLAMEKPYGLAVENNWLFVCDEGRNGVVIFDISQPDKPYEKGIIAVKEARDIILTYPYMIISTKTDFKIFNYSNVQSTYYLSSITLH
ncbi:MAG: hypothetical protein IT238_04115 [Bacteroidia bacterium]|nr:hypothetical protein [Bacteroidia bacterium]